MPDPADIEIATAELRAMLRRRMLRQARRVSRGILLGGAILAGIMALVAALNIYRMQEVYAETGSPVLVAGRFFFPVMNLLLFAAFAWFYLARSRLVAIRGKFVAGRIVGGRRSIEEDLVVKGTGTTPYLAAGQALEGMVTLFRRMLPTELKGFEIPCRGRWHYFDMYLFPDETPVPVGDNSVLCFVDTGRFWFYPPSPAVVRVAAGDPDAERLGQLATVVAESLADRTRSKRLTAGRAIRHAHRRQVTGLLCIAALLTLAGYPVYAAFGGEMLALMVAIIAVPTMLGLLLHKPPDF